MTSIEFEKEVSGTPLMINAMISVQHPSDGFEIEELSIYAKDSATDLIAVLDNKVIEECERDIGMHIPDGPEYEPEPDE